MDRQCLVGFADGVMIDGLKLGSCKELIHLKWELGENDCLNGNQLG